MREVRYVFPFALPQTPFDARLAEQEGLAPPFTPAHCHDAVVPVAGNEVLVGEPTVHCVSGAYAVIAVPYVFPLALPQTPLTTNVSRVAEQFGLANPPFVPEQVQVMVTPFMGKFVLDAVPEVHCVSGV